MANGIVLGGEDDHESGKNGGFNLVASPISISYPIKGRTIQERREEARKTIATRLIWVMSVLIFVSIIVGALLLYLLPEDKFSSKDLLNLVLAVGSVFSGLLGAAITFYFSIPNQQ